MKLKLNILLIILLMFQNAGAQTVERRILFEMKPDESIDYGEFYVEADFNKGRCFSAILVDTITSRRTFVFNGQRIASSINPFDRLNRFTGEPDNVQRYFRMPFIDANRTNGYAFAYRDEKDGVLVNLGGRVEGPFEDAYIRYFDSVTDFSFMYRMEGLLWINLSGEIFGPYTHAHFIGNNAFAYELGAAWYEYADGAISGPFIGGSPRFLAEKGRGAISPDGKHFISVFEGNGGRFMLNHDGKVKPLHKNIWLVDNLIVTDSGDFCLKFILAQNEKSYLLINNQLYGPFNDFNCGGPDMNTKGDWVFSYTNRKKEKFVRCNSGNFGPFLSNDDDMQIVRMAPNGQPAYLHGGVISFGDSSWPVFDGLTGIEISPKNKIAFSYLHNQKHYVHISENKTFGPYDYIVDGLRLFDDDTFKFAILTEFNEWKIINNGVPGETLRATEFLSSGNNRSEPYWFSWFDGYNAYLVADNGLIKPVDRFLYHSLENKMETFSADGKHTCLSLPENDYVLIDGVKYGKAAALRVWFSDEAQSFVWNCLEGNELVVYTCKQY